MSNPKDGGPDLRLVRLAVDHRSPLAVARDEWLASEEGRTCCDGTAHGQYLENRLVMAFIAGWDAAVAERAKEKP